MGGTMCTLAGTGRRSLSLLVTSLNLLLSLAGQVLVITGLYIKFVLESHVAVVIGNHGGALAYFLIAVGCILCFVSSAAGKVTFDAGDELIVTKRTTKLLVFTQACQGLSLILILAAAIMCGVHKRLIRDVLHTGIIAAIRLYRVNPKIKTGVDKIQMEFQCCGSRAAADWFKIPWIPAKYVDMEHPDVIRYIVDGDLIKDDAPFSCCSILVNKPCVHYNVQNSTAHQKETDAINTLYTKGCNDALEDYWKSTVLNPVLWALLFFGLMLMLSMTLSRLLQTSLDDALDGGDPSGDGDAYCIRSCPCAVIPTRDPSRVIKKKGGEASTDDDEGNAADGGDGGAGGGAEDFSDIYDDIGIGPDGGEGGGASGLFGDGGGGGGGGADEGGDGGGGEGVSGSKEGKGDKKKQERKDNKEKKKKDQKGQEKKKTGKEEKGKAKGGKSQKSGGKGKGKGKSGGGKGKGTGKKGKGKSGGGKGKGTAKKGKGKSGGGKGKGTGKKGKGKSGGGKGKGTGKKGKGGGGRGRGKSTGKKGKSGAKKAGKKTPARKKPKRPKTKKPKRPKMKRSSSKGKRRKR